MLKNEVKECASLAQALHKAFLMHGPKKFIGEKNVFNEFVWLTYDQVFHHVFFLSKSLKNLKINHRAAIGICLHNCKEWLLMDFACCFNDYISVGLHTSWDDNTLEFVIENARISVIVCHLSQLSKFQNNTKFEVIIVIGDKVVEISNNNVFWFNDLDKGSFFLDCLTEDQEINLMVPSWFGIGYEDLHHDCNDIYTLLYTSGTTGKPKGVCVSKSRWLNDANSNKFAGQDSPSVVSYLSLAHGADRGICWQACFSGVRIGQSAAHKPLELLEDFRYIQPTFLFCFSYLWAEFYAIFNKELEDITVKCIAERILINSTVELTQFKAYSSWDDFINTAANILGTKDDLLLTWFSRFGGRVFIPVTGGGFTSPEVLAWMSQLFMPLTTAGKDQSSRVKDAYGSSEFPGIAVNGVIDSEVQVSIRPLPFSSCDDQSSQHGEIMVRRRNTSQAPVQYWDNPLATSAALYDGWYRTGDIGCLIAPDGDSETDSKRLMLLGRVADLTELYVAGDSVWIDQTALEAIYTSCPAVRCVCLLADRNQDRPVAVVVPDWEYWLSKNGTIVSQPTALVQQTILQLLQQLASDYGQRENGRIIKPFEIPVAVILEREEWTVQNNFLTPTGKIRREKVRAKFQSLMESAYASVLIKQSMGNEVFAAIEASVCTSTSTITCIHPEFSDNQSSLPPPLVELLSCLKSQPSVAIECILLQPGDYLSYRFIPIHTEGGGEMIIEELNQQLDNLKQLVSERRLHWSDWSAEEVEAQQQAARTVQDTLDRQRLPVEAALQALCCCVESDDAGGYGDGEKAVQLLRELLIALTRRLVLTRRAYQRWADLGEHPSKGALMRRYCGVLDRLRLLASRTGLRLPIAIEYGAWLTQGEGHEELLTQSLGDAQVWCSICGLRIESGEGDSGEMRWHCADVALDRCVSCHKLAERLISCIGLATRRVLPYAAVLAQQVREAYPFNPLSLSCVDLLAGQSQCLWIQETAHFWQLRNRCEQPLQSTAAGYVAVDTPTSFIAAALKQYGHRPAIGIPDPDRLLFDPQRPLMLFPDCKLVHAAQLEWVRNRDYLWLTYTQLETLVMRTAKIIRSLVPCGSFVGISGYNGVEWAVADIAVAFAGCVSVGIHTTFDTTSALHVLQHYQIALLLCSSDLICAVEMTDNGALKRGPNSEGTTDFWTLENVFRAAGRTQDGMEALCLKHVLLLEDTKEAWVNSLGDVRNAEMTLLFGDTELGSLVDLVSSAPCPEELSVVLNLIIQPSITEQRQQIFTILFTSGSTGHPKGVVVTAAGFFSDISARNYIEPLVTVSYIPLSHSSDRLKMWEFLGNGGRIGFAHYSPENWLDHERDKKLHCIGTSGIDDIEGLFRQVQSLQPSAMACPPNIWTAVLHLYYNIINFGQNKESDFKQFPYRSFLVRPTDLVPVSGLCLDVTAFAATFIRRLFGPRIKYLVTGGATTSHDIMRFVRDLFPTVSFCDSYGATECGAIASDGRAIVSKMVRVRLSTVDKMQSDVGELLVCSPNMSVGYYKDEIRTRDSFFDCGHDSSGIPLTWYRTGDLVRVTDTQHYVIVSGERLWQPRIEVLGRLTSALRLSSGELLCPDWLETVFAVSPLLAQIFLFIPPPPHRQWLVALISRSPALDSLAAKDTLEEVNLLRQEIDRIAEIQGIRPHEVPREIFVDSARWTVSNGLLSSALKKHRSAVAARCLRLLAGEQADRTGA